MTKRKNIRVEHGYMPLPDYVAIRVGCKVSWVYYKTREEASVAAGIARHNAVIDSSMGYDFGYCSPGSISAPEQLMFPADSEYHGLYEVCIS
jgi:hypothetical protein